LKERLITLALALGALALVYILFLPKPVSPEAAPARPLSTETRPDGYQVIWRWLQSAQVREAAWRERYGQLAASFGQPAGGNVLLATLPYENTAGSAEIKALRLWVQQGNTLLIAAALDDTPLWSAAEGSNLIDEVWRLTGLKVSAVETDTTHDRTPKLRTAVTEIIADRNSTLEPRGTHPLMHDVHAVKIASALPSTRWRVVASGDMAVLNLAGIRGSDDAAVWLRREGRGQIILIGFAGVFSNANIVAGDNGQLLSNLLAWSLKPGGSVLFDDAHQGAVNYYDAKAFFADPRLHRTLAWLVFLWFVFVLGIQRLRTHTHDWRPIDITAFIGVSGEFLASATTPMAAAARLMANFFNLIRRRLSMREDGTPEWEWLAAQPRVESGEVRVLRDWYARVQAGKSVNLVKLQQLLCQLQEKIA
jgi:hypothetical protein